MGGSRRLTKRLMLGFVAAGLAVWPLALPAAAAPSGVDPNNIDYATDPPDDFEPDTSNVPSDAELLELAQTLSPPELQALLMGPFFLDSDGDGLPDPGEPGDLDLPPAEESLDQLVAAAQGAELSAETQAIADRIAEEGSLDYDPNDITGSGDSLLQGQCAGVAISYDGDGNVVDSAVGIGGSGSGLLVDTYGSGAGQRAFTADNRFEVRADGEVVYFGYLPYGGGEGPINHTWAIETGNLSLDSGGDDNPQGNNANAGVVDFADAIPGPLRFTGTISVTGWLFSENGLWCVAEGHAEFGGGFPPVAGGLAVLLAAGGVAGLLFNARPAITYKV